MTFNLPPDLEDKAGDTYMLQEQRATLAVDIDSDVVCGEAVIELLNQAQQMIDWLLGIYRPFTTLLDIA